MVAVAYGYHVTIAIFVLLEELRISVVGAEAHAVVVKKNQRNSRQRNGSASVVLRVAQLEFVQYRRGEGTNVAELTRGENISGGVGKTASTGCGTRPKRVGLLQPVELQKGPVTRIPVVVQASRAFIAIKQVANRLDLGAGICHCVVLERDIARNGAALQARGCTARSRSALHSSRRIHVVYVIL